MPGVTRALRLDASVFYYRYRDQQILGKVFDATSQSYIGRFVNANSRISGGEAELEWRPAAALSITQYVGFAEGYYTRQHTARQQQRRLQRQAVELSQGELRR